MANSNINQNVIVNAGNTGKQKYYFEPALINSIAFVPKGTIIPPADMVSTSAFATYVAGLFINNSHSSRWFGLVGLDKLTNKTKAPSSEDTGAFQLMNFKYAQTFEFRWLTNKGTFTEAMKFLQNGQDFYDFFLVDSNGTWLGTVDPAGSNGLMAFTSLQLFFEDWKQLTDKTRNDYTVSFTLLDRSQINENFAYYQAAYGGSNWIMPQSVVLTDVTSIVSSALSLSGSQVALTGVFSGGAADLGYYYGASLTSACFAAYDLTGAAANTITAYSYKTVTVAGQLYNCLILTLTSPSSGHLFQLSMASISVVNGVIANSNLANEVNGYANHQF